MTIKVKEFRVCAYRHPKAGPNRLKWRVWILVRFASDNPADWGELRAFGGGLTRVHTVKDDEIRKRSAFGQLLRSRTGLEGPALDYAKALPVWTYPTVPEALQGADVRLANDQHMKIYYAKEVPMVRRSRRDGRLSRVHDDWEYDPFYDGEAWNDPATSRHPSHIDLNRWHIIGKDAPSSDINLATGDQVEYLHQAEFQIRVPFSLKVVARKRLSLMVRGYQPAFNYYPREG
jgi:hypothetical protein